MKLTYFFLFSYLILLFNCCSDSPKQILFPTHIYKEKLSPGKKTKAIIYSWTKDEKLNLVGSNERFILGFENPKSKWYIDFELSEGFGTYEGGITSIEWLNEYELLIKRVINDNNKNLKYNIKLNEWILVNSDDSNKK